MKIALIPVYYGDQTEAEGESDDVILFEALRTVLLELCEFPGAWGGGGDPHVKGSYGYNEPRPTTDLGQYEEGPRTVSKYYER